MCSFLYCVTEVDFGHVWRTRQLYFFRKSGGNRQGIYVGLGFETSSYEAVFFTDGHSILREMLFTEFEAMLDGMFTDPMFKDNAAQGAYVKIDKRLNIVGAVFFILNFDDQGQADPKWNVALMPLLDQASTTVQVGGRDIAIATYSHCPIANQRDELWDPELTNSHNVITALVDAVRANKLGLLVSDHAVDVRPRALSQATVTPHVESPVKKSKLSLGSISDSELANERRRKRSAKFMWRLRERQREQLNASQRELDLLEKNSQRIEREMAERIEKLERELFDMQLVREKQDREVEKQRLEQEKMLDEAAHKHAANHEKLRRQLRQDLQQRLIEETSELQAKLDMREVEIHYREEQISRLQKQLVELNTVDPSLTQPVATFADLERRGLRYHIDLPGLPSLVVSAADIANFHASPDGYIAERLNMDVQQYKRWQAHVERPVCTASTASTGGATCGQLIEITAAKDFVSGVSDRCEQHRVRPASIVGDRHAM